MHYNYVGKLAHGKRTKHSSHGADRSCDLCHLSQLITLQMRRLEVLFSEFQELSQHSQHRGKRRLIGIGNSHNTHRHDGASPTRKASKQSKVWKRKPGVNCQAKRRRAQTKRLDKARFACNNSTGLDDREIEERFDDPRAECDAIGSVYHSPVSPRSVSDFIPVPNPEVCTTCDTSEHEDSVSKWLRPRVLASVSSFVLGIENSSFEKRLQAAETRDPISEPVPVDEDDLNDDPSFAFEDRREAKRESGQAMRQHAIARSSNPTARSSNDPCPVATFVGSSNTCNFAENEGVVADQAIASNTPQSGALKRRAREMSSPTSPVQLFDYGAGDCEDDSAGAELEDRRNQSRLSSQRASWSDWFFGTCVSTSNAGQSEDEAARERSVSDQITTLEEELRLMKEAELAAAPKLLVARLVSGRELIIDVTEVQCMADLRRAISAELGLDHNFGVKLLHNCTILDDGSKFSEVEDLIEKKEELTVIVEANNLRWACPPHFIRHQGVEVLEIIWDCRWDGYVYVLDDGTQTRNKGTPMLDKLFAGLRIAPQMYAH